MRQKKFWFTMSVILAVLALAIMMPTGAGAASKYKVLYKFCSLRHCADGANPISQLILDEAGNLYGTTSGAPAVAFKLKPNADGRWTESVLYDFGANLPWGGLIFDGSGNLYGTTENGGTRYSGTVFELSPNSGGGWTEQDLYVFGGGNDGGGPLAGLIFDEVGNLYGTTSGGGGSRWGTVFELTPNSGGGWTEHVLYSFSG
jgi:uncharacterized repeat protein (TIGR03803 family)